MLSCLGIEVFEPRQGIKISNIQNSYGLNNDVRLDGILTEPGQFMSLTIAHY